MQQLSLLPEIIEETEALTRHTFSHDGVCAEDARLALEERYADLLEETELFNRKLVSFQANKTDVLHSWMKYREGFSASLVEILIEQFGIEPGQAILDPFAGSGTTLLVAQMLGIDAVGIELLSHSFLAWHAKSLAFDYDVKELNGLLALFREQNPLPVKENFPHLRITRTAFPDQTERDLMAYTAWVESLEMSEEARTLCRLVLISILEDLSYTRKDGQYLRWDGRAKKVQKRNAKRVAKGKRPIRGIDKGKLPGVKEAFLAKFGKIIRDVGLLQQAPPPRSAQGVVQGNTLYELPKMQADRFAGVITSPPYANRYDYTRTYALELAYLGIGQEIFDLRQRQLSCTVENKPKLAQLEACYESIGETERYRAIVEVVTQNAALAEINQALQDRNQRGDINNRGVLRMIEQYFSELTFVFAELHRVCRPGARVAFVNDNVRYAGEVIPVDLLSTNLAENVGFEPVKVYVLPQRKGNSSQQMGKFGREALRKSLTLWRKL